MKRFFMSGTDTNCGKTYVTVELLKYLNRYQPVAQAIKPVASGAHEENGELLNADILTLQAANANPHQSINGWCFQAAIAPHLAAKKLGIQITAKAIKEFCEQSKYKEFKTLFIEGAGGLCVPLNEQETWINFLKLTHIPVILVVGMRLGCINHAILSEKLLKYYQIPCLGWIANFLDSNMEAATENLDTLIHWLSAPLLGRVKYDGQLILSDKIYEEQLI